MPSVRCNREAHIAGNTSTRVNENIRISPVRLIAADGEQRGIVSIEQARAVAEDAGLDLVEVAARARPPVVRIMDWGRYQYEQQKRARDARKKQHTVSVKEVKLRPRTDDHDLAFKLRNARRFLRRGSAVKFTVRFRGPELRRPELGQQLLETVQAELAEVASVESRSRHLEGRQLTMMLSPA
ncbi:MAG TPA: translation initiation factor IF-3 [Longimicrobiales bacterium]|nr:translation initiation factor IF-3 [Longimicrobiales bacterium]